MDTFSYSGGLTDIHCGAKNGATLRDRLGVIQYTAQRRNEYLHMMDETMTVEQREK